MPGAGGVPIAIAPRRGGGPPIVAVHGTGFCKETLFPVLDDPALAGRAWWAVDQRGHGDSGSPEPPYDWWEMAEDLVAVAGGLALPAAIGFGHSSGAALCLMAEILAPGTFAAIVAVEPIVSPPPYRRRDDHPFRLAALRRAPRFPSRTAALEAFRDRGPFAGWTDQAVEAYVDHGFQTTADGIELKCRREVEADLYSSAFVHGAWERLGEVTVPVLVVAGSASSSHPEPVVTEQAARLGNGTVRVLPGLGHFGPMERPDRFAAILAATSSAGFGLDQTRR